MKHVVEREKPVPALRLSAHRTAPSDDRPPAVAAIVDLQRNAGNAAVRDLLGPVQRSCPCGTDCGGACERKSPEDEAAPAP